MTVGAATETGGVSGQRPARRGAGIGARIACNIAATLAVTAIVALKADELRGRMPPAEEMTLVSRQDAGFSAHAPLSQEDAGG